MRPRRLLAALLTALVVAVALPAVASAHATLEASTPERGAALERPPATVTLRFDEPVEIAFGAIKVFDAKGGRVDAGATYHPSSSGKDVAVHLKRGLQGGGYTATYRVISADAHPVSGGFVFTVGSGAAPAETVDQLLQGSDAGPATGVALRRRARRAVRRHRARPRRVRLPRARVAARAAGGRGRRVRVARGLRRLRARGCASC